MYKHIIVLVFIYICNFLYYLLVSILRENIRIFTFLSLLYLSIPTEYSNDLTSTSSTSTEFHPSSKSDSQCGTL